MISRQELNGIEVQAIYEDIQRRSSEQFKCVVTSVVALGAILAALTQSNSDLIELLVLVPWVHSVFGIYWLDHAWAMKRATNYLKSCEEKIYESDAQGGYWRSISSQRKEAKRKRFGVQSMIIQVFPVVFYILPSIGSIATYVWYLVDLQLNEGGRPFVEYVFRENLLQCLLLIFGTLFCAVLISMYLRAIDKMELQ